MTATARKRRPVEAPARDLFAVPSRPAPETPPPPAPPAPEPPIALRRARDFAATVERVPGEVGRLVIRTKTDHGHFYRAYERSPTHFHGVTLPGDPTWGRIDTRRPAVEPDPKDIRAPIDLQLAAEAETLVAIRAACPETVQLEAETFPSCGVYPGPGYILLTQHPAVRYRAAQAAWRAK